MTLGRGTLYFQSSPGDDFVPLGACRDFTLHGTEAFSFTPIRQMARNVQVLSYTVALTQSMMENLLRLLPRLHRRFYRHRRTRSMRGK